MKIALSTDHAGFERLKKLKAGLEMLGYECVDYGPTEFNPGDDYPDFIHPIAAAIALGSCQYGIIFGGSGQGEAMVANRHKEVRCTVWYGTALAIEPVDAEGHMSTDPYEILKLSKEHNNANMLSIAGRFVTDDETLKVAVLWLNHTYQHEDRHEKRIKKIERL